MKNKILYWAALQLGACAAACAAEGAAPVFDLAAETRQAVNREHDHALSEATVYANLNWKPAAGWRIRARTRAQWENRLEPAIYRRTSADEAYVEYADDACSFRLGAQQVVWGAADRLRVLDLIHPLNLRENLFGDQVQSRLPLGMLNSECSIGEQSVQWLVIPHTRDNRRPAPGSRFHVPTPADQVSAAGLRTAHSDRPQWDQPKDWSVGAKWAGQLAGADLALHAFHGWKADPVLHLESAAGVPAYGAVHERFSMLGASVSAPAGPFVVKSELSVVPRTQAYYVTPARLIDSTAAREQRALIGLDYQATEWFFSSQYYVQKNRAAQVLIEPATQKIVTLAARRQLLQGRLEMTGYVAHDLTNPAQFASVTARFDFSAQVQGTVAVDYFRGEQASLGRFHPESRVVASLRYNFN